MGLHVKVQSYFVGESFNGRTQSFDLWNEGSIPSSPAKKKGRKRMPMVTGIRNFVHPDQVFDIAYVVGDLGDSVEQVTEKFSFWHPTSKDETHVAERRHDDGGVIVYAIVGYKKKTTQPIIKV